MMIKAKGGRSMVRRANIRECLGEGGVTVQTLPWVLISPTIAPDGKHLLVPQPLNQSSVCLHYCPSLPQGAR